MSASQTWPYPGDSPATRARRVALAYRQQLHRANPSACAELDARMRGMGQNWVIPRPVTADPTAWISAADAAELAALSMVTIAGLRRSGRLPGRRNGHRWEYQVRNVLALAVQPRTRTHHEQNSRTTGQRRNDGVTLRHAGRGAP